MVRPTAPQRATKLAKAWALIARCFFGSPDTFSASAFALNQAFAAIFVVAVCTAILL